MDSKNRGMGKYKLAHWRFINIWLLVYDYFAVCLSFFIALMLRFDFKYSTIPTEYFHTYLKIIPIYACIVIAVFGVCKLYRSIWRYASYNELLYMIGATCLTLIMHIAMSTMFCVMPIAYYAVGIILQFIFTLGVRFSYRFILLLRSVRGSSSNYNAKRVMIIGAGNAGQMILRDIMHGKDVNDRVICIIDDNKNKWNRTIEGVPVVGGRDSILHAVNKYQIEKIYVVIPSATAEQKRDILNICNETTCEVKTLPGMKQFISGSVSVSDVKKVSIEDLLGREPIRTDMSGVFQFITGKTILVTGGGGSIGSELCRQIAKHSPKQLIIFDVYENNAYDIQMELKVSCPDLNMVVIIGSIRDSRRLNQVFSEYRPDVVYHAAAHKHVPLMEDSPCESIKNNVLGTYKTAYAAMAYGCKRFVLISTDKAVNPTNIMGASKRLSEMIVQSFDKISREGRQSELPAFFTHTRSERDELDYLMSCATRTEFVAVRFGNVLGSNGSVIPLFKKMIENGGPITVTHPDIIRYFMTIPEAVSLVLQAGTYAHGGEIFVLDMGNPMKIDTLARNLIKLSGLVPDVDIKIEYTGLRPGEKLYEEKLMAEEGLEKTDNKLIHIGKPVQFDADLFLSKIGGLMDEAYINSPDIRKSVMELVSTYHPAGYSAPVVEEKKHEDVTLKQNILATV